MELQNCICYIKWKGRNRNSTILLLHSDLVFMTLHTESSVMTAQACQLLLKKDVLLQSGFLSKSHSIVTQQEDLDVSVVIWKALKQNWHSITK